MAVTIQGNSSFSSDSVTYIAEKTLKIAKKAVVFQQLGEKASLPHQHSKTFQYTRYDRLALPLAALTEGTTPDNTSISISTVSAVADQWGAYVAISDVADMTIKHPVMQKAIDLMGYQAAETIDREVINVLLAGTSVVFPAAITKRSALAEASSHFITTTVIRKAIAALRANGVHEYEGQDFMAVVDPYVEMDVSADSTFQNAGSYSNIKVLQNGEIGKWMGARWMRSNNIPTVTGIAAESYTTPASPAGTFAAANYRIAVAHYDASTGFLVKLSQNSAVAFASLDSLAGTTANTAHKFKVFIGIAAGGADDVMYQGVEATYGTGFIPANTAFSVLAPPTSGDSIAGSSIPASGEVVHCSWLFGKEAYAVVDLQKLQSFLTPNQASDSDPLVQRRKAGWKLMFKAVICNNNFMTRIETVSAYD
jgi:N4-gp56 family major capsid protein